MNTISVVIPVYQGEKTLGPLVDEIAPLTGAQKTPKGISYRIAEVILVHDGAIDRSDLVMQSLAARYGFISLIWLSRNFGQHAATLAGMASSSTEWVATMDEDGQFDPSEIGKMLDQALDGGAKLVYGDPVNLPPHGWVRNLFSRLAKWIFLKVIAGNDEMSRFNSFRLIEGEVARSLAAYCGPSVYLDVALLWIIGRSVFCPVHVRRGRSRPSAYGFGKLVEHFLRLLLTSGTRPLRFISLLGIFSILFGIFFSLYAAWQKLTAQVPIQGWASLIITVCLLLGCLLFSLGVIAEYLGVVLTMSMGKPLYLTVSKPSRSKSQDKKVHVS